MKKNILFVVMLAMVVGCGRPQTTQKQDLPKDAMSMPSVGQESNQLIQAGVNYLNEGEITNAIKSFDDAIRQEPTNPENYVVLGQVYLRLNKYAKAVDTFSAATRVAPDNGEIFYLLALANIFKEKKNQSSGDLIEAQNSHKSAILAVQKSIDIFMQKKDEDNFKKSVALLKGLTEQTEEKN